MIWKPEISKSKQWQSKTEQKRKSKSKANLFWETSVRYKTAGKTA